MKAAFEDTLVGASSTDAAELLVAELRNRRKRLEQLIRLVQEQVGRDLQNTEIRRAKRPRPGHRCRATALLGPVSTKRATGQA